jgi:hypothetical protein
MWLTGYSIYIYINLHVFIENTSKKKNLFTMWLTSKDRDNDEFPPPTLTLDGFGKILTSLE